MKKIIFGLIFALIIVTSISLVSASDAAYSGSENNTDFNDYLTEHNMSGDLVLINECVCIYRTGNPMYYNAELLNRSIDTNHTDDGTGGAIWEEN